METALLAAAKKRARGHYGFTGGLSELISRLLAADLKHKRGVAHRHSRRISKREVAA